jgi:hypothetical protein
LAAIQAPGSAGTSAAQKVAIRPGSWWCCRDPALGEVFPRQAEDRLEEIAPDVVAALGIVEEGAVLPVEVDHRQAVVLERLADPVQGR